MKPHTQVAIDQEKTERAAPSPAVIGSGDAMQAPPDPERPRREIGPRTCPICGNGLTGRQTSACSDKCRAALSRRRRAQAITDREREIRGHVKALAKQVGLTAEDFA